MRKPRFPRLHHLSACFGHSIKAEAIPWGKHQHLALFNVPLLHKDSKKCPALEGCRLILPVQVSARTHALIDRFRENIWIYASYFENVMDGLFKTLNLSALLFNLSLRDGIPHQRWVKKSHVVFLQERKTNELARIWQNVHWSSFSLSRLCVARVKFPASTGCRDLFEINAFGSGLEEGLVGTRHHRYSKLTMHIRWSFLNFGKYVSTNFLNVFFPLHSLSAGF